MGRRFFFCLIFLMVLGMAPKQVAAQQSCDSLTSLKIPNATVTSATAINPPPDLVIPLPPSPIGAASKLSVPSRSVALPHFPLRPAIRISVLKSGCP